MDDIPVFVLNLVLTGFAGVTENDRAIIVPLSPAAFGDITEKDLIVTIFDFLARAGLRGIL